MDNKQKLVSKRFGRLVVTSYNEEESNKLRGKSKYKKPFWNCKCDCGKETIVTEQSLKNGSTQSCGCLHKEKAKENMENVNNKMWENEDFKKMQSEKMKQMWENNDFREAQRKTLKKGAEHPSYKPDLTEEDRQDRRLLEGYNEWKYKVKEQAHFTCDCCGDDKGGNLVSHHLNDYKHFPKQRLDINNGVCLCESCHKKFHKWIGNNRKGCTKEQYEEFKALQK